MLSSLPSNPLSDADPLCSMGAAELARGFAAGDISPVEVASAVLARAEQVDGRLNAFTRIDHEGALAAAAASTARWRRNAALSPVDGVPATIKDIVLVKGWPAGYGSLTTDRTPAAEDSPSVMRLRDAGAVIIGSTTTPEFGWKAVTDSPLSGVTRNPWNPALTSGGSSGGAAVAAATGAGVLHLGTDGGGSIRVPAAFCGIVGLKPSFGRVPAYPASAFGTVAHLGPMARTVDDALAMLMVMSGQDRRDWYQGPAVLPALAMEQVSPRPRIGYWRKPPCGALDPEIGAIVDGAVARLEREGATIEPVDLPEADLLWIFQTLWFAGAANRASQLGETDLAKLDPGLREIVGQAKDLPAPEYLRASAARVKFGLAMDRLLERFDFLVSPATSIPPFAAGLEVPPSSGLQRWTEWAGFSFPINLSQQPAMVVPCGRSAAGLPVAMQFIGDRGADSRVLSIARAFEASNRAI